MTWQNWEAQLLQGAGSAWTCLLYLVEQSLSRVCRRSSSKLGAESLTDDETDAIQRERSKIHIEQVHFLEQFQDKFARFG